MRRIVLHWGSASLLVVSFAAVQLQAADVGSTLSTAQELHKRTDYNASLALLNRHTANAETNFLIGENYFMLGDFKNSAGFLQKAVEEAPNDAEYADWLGRAYGRRAESANPISAPRLASKARQCFETAVSLNPRNLDALGDLFDFDLAAPGFLGGGYDKAQAVADRIQAIDPAEGHVDQSKLARKSKEFNREETELKQAVAASPGRLGPLLAYADFLSAHGRTGEADAALAEAQRLRPDSPRIWYAKADLLIRQGRDLPQAKDLLERYMHATITVDDPPKYEAQRLLKQAGGA